ncbi:hypothetical protein ACTZWW_04250 [Salinarimonas sp. NSM]|uniref:hypothetical protein n=1 Tax=Salinarimonas sp. NSM TaxID=3458003 RepID=UPI0040374E90
MSAQRDMLVDPLDLPKDIAGTPAARAYRREMRLRAPAYIWTREDVQADLEEAARIMGAIERHPRPSAGGSVLGRLSDPGDGRKGYAAARVDWARAVYTWPEAFLLSFGRRSEHDAVRLWLATRDGSKSTEGDRLEAHATRAARRRGILWIAAELMRDGRLNARDRIVPEPLEAPAPAGPAPAHGTAWRAPESPEEAANGMPDAAGFDAILSAIVADARALRGDPEAIVHKLVQIAVDDWFADHEPGTLTMTRKTKLFSRWKDAALTALREASAA